MPIGNRLTAREEAYWERRNKQFMEREKKRLRRRDWKILYVLLLSLLALQIFVSVVAVLTA